MLQHASMLGAGLQKDVVKLLCAAGCMKCSSAYIHIVNVLLLLVERPACMSNG